MEIYAACMRATERENTVALDLMQGLRGKAWDAVEDLDITTLETDKGWELVLKREARLRLQVRRPHRDAHGVRKLLHEVGTETSRDLVSLPP